MLWPKKPSKSYARGVAPTCETSSDSRLALGAGILAINQMLALTVLITLFPLLSSPAAEHLIKPGDPPQTALDRAAPGDRLVF